MLQLCDIGHDEVCYETRECPACAIQELMQAKIDSLQEVNDRLTIALDDMQQAITDAEEVERT